MILSGIEIRKAIESGKWYCNKEAKDLNFGPNSVDVTLNDFFLVARKDIGNDPINLEKDDGRRLFKEVVADNFVLPPNELVLASARERFDCAEALKRDGKDFHFVQHYEGRSTLGRMGLQSHVTAGFGDYGFNGAFTLELINNSPWPLVLKSGMRIGQVYFEVVVGELFGYEGYDQKDCKPQYPRLGKNRF